MKIGFDYWNVLSHYPKELGAMAQAICVAFSEGVDIQLYVISAIGENRIGTVENELIKVFSDNNLEADEIFNGGIHEVVFARASESPKLKLLKCKELGITVFFDDRKDVCDLLNKNGILAMQVPRKDRTRTDIQAERRTERKEIPSDWWERLKNVEHVWGDPEPIEYYDGKIRTVRYCKTCFAMYWVDWSTIEPQFDSCSIMTDWPGDDAPCRCTRRQYLEAHKLI